MRLSLPFLVLGGTAMAVSHLSSSKEDLSLNEQDVEVTSFAVKPYDGPAGTLSFHWNETLQYLNKDLGINMAQLQSHQELFTGNSSEGYTFPGGIISWDTTEQNDTSLSPGTLEQVTCNQCVDICFGTSVVPFGFIA